MLSKFTFRPGVNRENTRYTNEGGWYESEKVRFRQGTPEKIGGWQRMSSNTYLGVCRSLWQWVNLAGTILTGVGTNLKFYLDYGSAFYDITPIRATASLTNPFTATNGSSVIRVYSPAHGAETGAYVTFSGAAGLGGNVTAAVLNQEYQLTYVNTDYYDITVAVTANATDAAGSPGGGATVSAVYQVNPGPAINTPVSGWGASYWAAGAWGTGSTSSETVRLWSQTNFGEDLVFGPRGGAMYYWDVTSGLSSRGVNVNTLPGASDVPVVQNIIMVSDLSRFVLAFGTNEIGTTDIDPLLIRWSDQESVTQWTPAATNQAGDVRLSHGSKIVAAIQARQEILVWTDTALYSMQYVGYPEVWKTVLLADNISITGPNSPVTANSSVYWMGVDKFYKYEGTVQTLKCDLRQFIYNDINVLQYEQIFGGTNEGFNEAWWFYCSDGSTTVDKYVIYNYLENVWYYGTMARTAWLDSGLYSVPIAATYSNNLVAHETGLDDGETGTPQAINAYIVSSEFDIDDGHNFGFVWRVIPDLSFQNSTATSPTVTMTLYALQNSGSGYNSPGSVAGSDNAPVVRTATYPIEAYTGQIYTRVRGRQLALKIESNQLETTWQLGSPRIDIRKDGRR